MPDSPFIILKTDYCYLWFFYKSDLHISTVGKNIEFIRMNTFKSGKPQYSPDYLWDKGFKGTVVNLALPSLYTWSLELRLQSSWKTTFYTEDSNTEVLGRH